MTDDLLATDHEAVSDLIRQVDRSVGIPDFLVGVAEWLQVAGRSPGCDKLGMAVAQAVADYRAKIKASL